MVSNSWIVITQFKLIEELEEWWGEQKPIYPRLSRSRSDVELLEVSRDRELLDFTYF